VEFGLRHQTAPFCWRHTGKLLSPIVYFQIEMENENNIVLQYQSVIWSKLTKTLECSCNSKNYLANSRFVPTIDLLTFPPIGGTFFRIQDGSKPMSLETLLYLVPRSRKKSISRDENAPNKCELPHVTGSQSEALSTRKFLIRQRVIKTNELIWVLRTRQND
jgi:hypothetical protein